MRRPNCQLPADVMVCRLHILMGLFFSLVYFPSDLYALLTLGWERSGRTNAAKIECAHPIERKLFTDYNHKILTFHSIYDYFSLLKANNTITFIFHQYLNGKLSSHQPSYMHNTRHRTNSNLNTPLFK